MTGCLVALLAVGVLTVVAAAVGVYVVRQMFPTTDSVQQAATCGILRVVVNNAESAIEQTDSTPAEKAEMQQGVREARAEFERQCGPLR